MLRVLGRYVPRYGKKSSRKGLVKEPAIRRTVRSSSSQGSWPLAEEHSVQSSLAAAMPRLRHNDYLAFKTLDHDSDHAGLTQDELDRLSVWRRRRSTSSSCSSDSSSSEEEEDDCCQRRELRDRSRSYKLKDIFGVLRRSIKSETGDVASDVVSSLRASASEAAAAEDLRLASLKASESELKSAINNAEEDLALLVAKVDTEVSKVPKDKENQPPRRKVVRAGGRTSKQRKTCAPARGCRSKQTP